jgi:hypothetical protein
VLNRLAQEAAGGVPGDHFAKRNIVQNLRREISELLGKETGHGLPLHDEPQPMKPLGDNAAFF